MKNSKLGYYLTNLALTLIPASFMRWRAKRVLTQSTVSSELQTRINYYNKHQTPFTLSQAVDVAHFEKTGGSAYYFDLKKVVTCFSPSARFHYINGDVIDVPSEPSFVKSRPIDGDNAHSVLLKLNAIRHYQFVNDTIPFKDKKDAVVWRGTGFRPNRRLLLEEYFDHPRCDVGRVDSKEKDQLHFVVPKMSVAEQLKYKFILSLEGMDVATNLKWIMSSNSLCFTPKLRYETWYMEGLLEAGVHFVEVKDDFSDLIEKMDYYLAHPEKAQQIIRNANQWVEQFKDSKQERLLSLLVAKKYFEHSH